MKTSEIKPGQLFAVHFPYAATPEERAAKYGFRVTAIVHPPPYLNLPENCRGIQVTNVKTQTTHRFGMTLGKTVPPNWVLLEDVP